MSVQLNLNREKLCFFFDIQLWKITHFPLRSRYENKNSGQSEFRQIATQIWYWTFKLIGYWSALSYHGITPLTRVSHQNLIKNIQKIFLNLDRFIEGSSDLVQRWTIWVAFRFFMNSAIWNKMKRTHWRWNIAN